MIIEGWKYYNHAAIPTTAPHEIPDTHPVENGKVWKIDGGRPLLARWTSDYDCGCETNWWYVVKDDSFELAALKSDYRYKINKGVKYFAVRSINPLEYVDELYDVFIAAFESWPAKYRPQFTYEDAEKLAQKLSADPDVICYGAFYRETGELCGFIQAPTYETYAELQVQRVKPMYEKLQINAALVYGMLEDNAEKLEKGNFYILDGARSISHETHFQDYLEKYFGFRKAYCHLHIRYNPQIRWLVKMLYPLRRILLSFDGIGLAHSLNGVLKMEEICRTEKVSE